MASDALGVRASAGRALLGGSASPSAAAEAEADEAEAEAADGVPMSSALRLRDALGVAAAAASWSLIFGRGG